MIKTVQLRSGHWNTEFATRSGLKSRSGAAYLSEKNAMRKAISRVRRAKAESLNLASFEDWTAIASILGANEANQIFARVGKNNTKNTL